MLEQFWFYLSIPLFCGAWYAHVVKKQRLASVLLGIAALFLRVYISLDNYPHPWDERYHALVAKNLLKSPLQPMLYAESIIDFDYRNWVANEVWLHKPPLTLWSIALSLKSFGISVFAIRIPSIFLSLLSIFFTYGIAKSLFTKNIAFMSAFLLAINGLVLELVGGRVPTDHVDIHFMSFIVGAIYFAVLHAQKKKLRDLLLMTLFLSFALLTKWLPALIVLPLHFILCFHYKSWSLKALLLNYIVVLLVLFCIVSPWHFYIHSYFPNEASWEASYNLKHLSHVVENREGNWYYYLNKIRVNCGEAIYFVLIFFAIGEKKFELKRIFLITWFIIPFLFFSLVATKMQAYLLFTAPALMIMTAFFFYALKESKHFLLAKFKYVFLFVLMFIPVRYSLERLKPMKGEERHADWVEEIQRFTKNKDSKHVLFNYEHAMETMFFSDVIAYTALPSFKELLELKNKGYNIYINTNGSHELNADMKTNFICLELKN